ncbi:MAG TPA: Gp19/Gp15/Gp42 family protein [Ilumatobacteraceae bacterium]|nr:Gp19/Gp15/Gp42 family protein [Ilumatobacteraceae bacterium]
MANFATVNGVEQAWRALTPTEQAQADHYLALASALIRHEFASIDARVAADPAGLGVLVKGVTVEMVKRVLINPEGLRSVQESIDDYSRTMTRDSSMSSGGLFLTDLERTLLTPTSRRGAFSIAPVDEGCR